MQNYLHALPRYLLFLAILVNLAGPAFSQTFAHASGLMTQKNTRTDRDQSMTSKRSVQAILFTLEEKYHVSFNYDDGLVKGLNLKEDFNWSEHEELEKILKRLVNEVQLRFEKIDQYNYLILSPKKKEAQKEIKNEKVKSSINGHISSPSEFPQSGIGNSGRSFTQQTFSVSGTVIDTETREPLPGVNIVIKNTSTGTVSDAEGKYTISMPDENGVLVFSYIGYVQEEVAVNARSVIDMSLIPDITTLGEVVVVGYGEQKQSQVTGAVVNVPVEDIQNLPVSNLSQALIGRVPGLSVSGGSKRPGESATLSIRQTFSFSKDGGTEIPLIVIDDMIQVDPESGLPTLDLFNSLDPSEIETITVLKDASAAIYGARASQGAIIVKTKRGKAGKPRFNYSGQFSFNDAVSHSKTMSAYDYGVWHNRFLKAAEKDDEGENLFSAEELEEMKGLDYDWLDAAWSGATQNKHSLSMSGGGETATYFAGATYFTQKPNLGTEEYDRWNFRTGLNVNITDDLKLSGSVSAYSGEVEKSYTKVVSGINDSGYGSKARSGTERADYGYLLHMPKYIPWQTTIDGEEYWVSPFPRTDRNLGSANTNRTIAGWNYFSMLNSGSKVLDKNFSYNTNFSLQYDVPFINGLSFRGTFARTQNSSNSEQIQLPFTLARHPSYDQEGQHLASAVEEWEIDVNERNSRVYYDQISSKSTQANFFINYDRTFGDHSINAMASVERSEASYAFSRLAYENTDADYLGTSKTAGELSDNTYASKSESGTLSYLGRLNYNYKSKYLLQFLFRSDASTKFAPENYWGFFPAAQAGWVMSGEDWFRNAIPWVDFLKLRYSVGKTGKDNIKAWRWAQYYSVVVDKGFQFGEDGGQLGSSLSPDVTPNRNVGWDATIKHNVGMDLNVLDNRLGVGVDFYYDKTKDMLTNMAGAVGVPVSVGGGFAEENYAAVDAWGTEFNINWGDHIGEDFSYNVGVLFGFNNNKIKKYPEQALTHPSENQIITGRSAIFPIWGFETWKETSGGDGILRTDEDVQSYWNYLEERAAAAGTEADYLGINSVDGIRKGMLAYKDVGGDFNTEDGTQLGPDGRIDENLDYVKLVDQDRTYGFTTNLRLKYKGISLSTQISTSWGGYRSIDVVKQGTSSSHNMWAHESYWVDMYDPDDNVDGKYPNLAYEDQILSPSDFWQLNTFRCFVRNLSITYDIPEQVTSIANIERATIGITGNNLWDFYNPYPDRYRNMYDTSYEGYPTLRTWAINLNVAF